MTGHDLIAVIRTAPNGLTTREVMERFPNRWKNVACASSVLGRLYQYGRLDREGPFEITHKMPEHKVGWRCLYYRWRAKP